MIYLRKTFPSPTLLGVDRAANLKFKASGIGVAVSDIAATEGTSSHLSLMWISYQDIGRFQHSV